MQQIIAMSGQFIRHFNRHNSELLSTGLIFSVVRT